MLNRWSEDPPGSALEALVHQSRLVGAEESLVLWGGGNNSLKAPSVDLVGNPIEIMYIKGSGSDMKSMVASQFPAVRLDYIEPLLHRQAMTDEEMVAYLAKCLTDPASPRPSIETLLHAFLPARSVLHTHADAILSVTNNRGRDKSVRECFGDKVIVVPYARPGFALSRDVAARFSQQPDARAIVLMNHGLITWGDSAREAYERHIEMVSHAEQFVSAKIRKREKVLPEDDARAASIAPFLRGLLPAAGRLVLELDRGEEVLSFLAHQDIARITSVGPATPDHLLYTKRFPLLLEKVPAGDERETLDRTLEQTLKQTVARAMTKYAEDYRAYFQAHAGPGETMLEPFPRVILVPGLGMWTAGKDARAARIVRDIYRHTMQVIEGAEALGGFSTLSEGDAFDAEYWPLELYKLSLLPKEKELAGRVVIVTGGGSGIGRAIAIRFAAEGAHVVVTDIDGKAAEAVASSIVDGNGFRRAIPLKMDVTREADVAAAFDRTLLEYGGVDVVVSNAGIARIGAIDQLSTEDWSQSLAVNTTGHFFVSRAALRTMRAQGRGGSIVFIATKNVTAPGKDFGAYSVSKAGEAQLCRIVAIEGGEFGIRSNMLNPDAVFEGSQLWTDEMRQARAKAYSFDVSKLPDHYRDRTLLKTAVTAEDVAEAALFLAGDRSGRTTGAMIPVDGGIREAFVR